MKKTLFGSLVAFVLAIGLASCGEKLLTPEQVEAEINKGVEAGMPAVKTTEDANCEASFGDNSLS